MVLIAVHTVRKPVRQYQVLPMHQDMEQLYQTGYL